jgi:hypothetical protein
MDIQPTGGGDGNPRAWVTISMRSTMKKKDHFSNGCLAWDEGRLADAFNQFQLGAIGGDNSCQLNLGYFYDVGIHVTKDLRQAIVWYFKAHREGNPVAASNIATVFRDLGQGARAVRWFLRSVRAGDGNALVELGKMYERGLGVTISPNKACEYYFQAISHQNITLAGLEYAEEAIERLGCRRAMSLLPADNTDKQRTS